MCGNGSDDDFEKEEEENADGGAERRYRARSSFARLLSSSALELSFSGVNKVTGGFVGEYSRRSHEISPARSDGRGTRVGPELVSDDAKKGEERPEEVNPEEEEKGEEEEGRAECSSALLYCMFTSIRDALGCTESSAFEEIEVVISCFVVTLCCLALG